MIRELEHRVVDTGDTGEWALVGAGSIGSHVHRLLEVLRKETTLGDSNAQSEFRQRMFFVYIKEANES